MSTTSSSLREHIGAFRDENDIPAVGAAIVTPRGLEEIEVIGERVRGRGDQATIDDRWHVGSCGKSMTGVLWARLVEHGSGAWGVPIPSLFPDLRDSMDPGWASITIDDVFVCQSGLPSNLTRSAIVAAWDDRRPVEEQRTEIAAQALARPPRSPGRFVYSNLGYIVIGAAIERITGRSYEAALRSHVFEPLGITSAGFGPPPEIWGHGGRVLMLGPLGAIDLGRGKPVDPATVRSDNPAAMSPAGRMYLTLEDWASFHRVFLTDGTDFLHPDSIERLLTPAPGRGRRMSPGWGQIASKTGKAWGMQGSNTYWVATAVMDPSRSRTALVVTNDGRPRLLRRGAELALRLATPE